MECWCRDNRSTQSTWSRMPKCILISKLIWWWYRRWMHLSLYVSWMCNKFVAEAVPPAIRQAGCHSDMASQMWKAIAAAQHWGMLFENMLFACNTPLTSSNSTDAVHQPVNAIGQSHRGAHQSVNTTMSTKLQWSWGPLGQSLLYYSVVPITGYADFLCRKVSPALLTRKNGAVPSGIVWCPHLSSQVNAACIPLVNETGTCGGIWRGV